MGHQLSSNMCERNGKVVANRSVRVDKDQSRYSPSLHLREIVKSIDHAALCFRLWDAFPGAISTIGGIVHRPSIEPLRVDHPPQSIEDH